MPADGESKTPGGGTHQADRVPDRRRDPLFRSLIDEMMQQIRELRTHAGPWPADERARVEADLERIMAQVRNAALRSGE
jgi:hypothetical protein